MMNLTTETIKTYLLTLQTNIEKNLKHNDPKLTFQHDHFNYPGGGNGRTHVGTGDIIEHCGVNFSHVKGDNLPAAATHARPQLQGKAFEAIGVSVIIHPRNPFIPTTHMNVRFFKTQDNSEWWFGGGFDLTPYYGFPEDCIHWHTVAKTLCDPFGETIYNNYKEWCDKYFYLKHRNEPRGIGGLFFDDLNQWAPDRCFEFMQAVGNGFLDAYFPIVEKRKEHAYSDAQRDFQLYRRGRYVEFNLLYDRGTLFGLQQPGSRTESILASMPPLVKWKYNWTPEENSDEKELYDKFLKPKNWLFE